MACTLNFPFENSKEGAGNLNMFNKVSAIFTPFFLVFILLKSIS